jgi:hypothetical protein
MNQEIFNRIMRNIQQPGSLETYDPTRAEKDKLTSEMIAAQTEEFLAKGGKIEVIEQTDVGCFDYSNVHIFLFGREA